MRIIILILISTVYFDAIGQTVIDNKNNKSVIQQFEGRWSGTAKAYFPRDQEKANRVEKVRATGTMILKDSYVELQSTWTQSNGAYRTLLTLWNYHSRKDSFQILYLYDNWPGRVDYTLSYDTLTHTFNGFDTFIAKGGIQAEEKVEWIISEDGSEIRSTEYNHLATDQEGYWPKTFEFVLKRED